MGTWNKKDVLANAENVPGRWQGVDFNVNAKHVYQMLENATTSRDRTLKDNAKQLLTWMDEGPWQIRAGGHEGGHGGGQGADPNPHVTLRVNGNGYHLGYRVKSGALIVVSITGQGLA